MFSSPFLAETLLIFLCPSYTVRLPYRKEIKALKKEMKKKASSSGGGDGGDDDGANLKDKIRELTEEEKQNDMLLAFHREQGRRSQEFQER